MVAGLTPGLAQLRLHLRRRLGVEPDGRQVVQPSSPQNPRALYRAVRPVTTTSARSQSAKAKCGSLSVPLVTRQLFTFARPMSSG